MDNYLADIIDSANEGIYVTDPERRFLVWNEAAERISGYSRSEIIGRSCFDNILDHTDGDGHSLCMTGCPLKAAIDSGKPHGPEVVYLRRKDGARIAVEVKTAPIRRKDGTILGGVEIFQDVTERLERERLLRERKEKLEAVLDNIGDGILFLDTTGAISAVNKPCAEMFDLADGTPGMTLELLPPGLPLMKALSQTVTLFRNSLAGELCAKSSRCGKENGRFRCWTAAIDRTTSAPPSRCYECDVYRTIRAFLEKPRELTVGDRAITAISSFIELRDTNDLWEVIVFHDVAAEKLDAALKVAGAAAHELRQPLQIVVVLADMLERDLGNNEKLLPLLQNLLANCERMNGIITKMTAITSYRTKEYVNGGTILDIDHSCRQEELKKNEKAGEGPRNDEGLKKRNKV